MVARPALFALLVLSLLSADLLAVDWTGGIVLSVAQAQINREAPRDNVRRRRAQQKARHNPYWDGFILKRQGDCQAAIIELAPIAQRGRGYEEAQTALGECLLRLAGLPLDDSQQAPPRAAMLKSNNFKRGQKWILHAAKSGNFMAQGILVALYAANLGPDEDAIEGAKWAHLYLTNPKRLNLGVPIMAQPSIDYLQMRINKTDWLLGKTRARNWSPDYNILMQTDKTERN